MNTEENDTEAELAAWELLREARLKLTTVTEQRDRLLDQREQWRLSSVCRELIAQRDRLAKALEQLMTYQPRSTVIAMNEHHVWRDAKEALQSLTSNTINDDPRRKNEKENR